MIRAERIWRYGLFVAGAVVWSELTFALLHHLGLHLNLIDVPLFLAALIVTPKEALILGGITAGLITWFTGNPLAAPLAYLIKGAATMVASRFREDQNYATILIAFSISLVGEVLTNVILYGLKTAIDRLPAILEAEAASMLLVIGALILTQKTFLNHSTSL